MRRKESRIVLAVILGLLLFWGGLSVTAEAANGEEETPEAAREMMEDLDFTDVDKMMREIFPDERIRFADVLETFMEGDVSGALQLAGKGLLGTLFSVLSENRQAMLHIQDRLRMRDFLFCICF